MVQLVSFQAGVPGMEALKRIVAKFAAALKSAWRCTACRGM